MENHPGVFIVLEGVDGSGKGTQFRLLTERLEAVGYQVATFDFPRYSEPSSHFVKKYLNGGYGPASSINPYTASMFFALDRYEASAGIRKALNEGKIVLSNRYVGSNMAHQGGKFGSEAEQRGFFIWADSLEYQLLGIPRPTLNVFLSLPAEISYDLVAKKAKRDYTPQVRDEHEGDLDHLQRGVLAYKLLCKLFPKDFLEIECAENGKILDIPTINNKVWLAVSPLLIGLPKANPKARVVKLEDNDNPALVTYKTDNTPVSTPGPQEEQKVQNLSGISQRHLLSTPGVKLARIAKSNKQPEDIHPAKDLEGKLKKYDKEILALSKEILDFCNKFKASVQIGGKDNAKHQSGQEAVINSLKPLFAGDDIVLIAGADMSANGKAQNSPIVDKLSERLNGLSAVEVGLRLDQADPKNELDIVSELLYPYSNLSSVEITDQMENTSYQEKAEFLQAMAKAGSESLINQLSGSVRYGFDIVCAGDVAEQLIQAADWSYVQVQPVSPRSGYLIPDLVEEAGLAEEYSICFDKSLELYSRIQSDDMHELAEYGTLKGHNIRWHGQIDIHEAVKLLNRSTNKMDDTRFSSVYKSIEEAISERHPIIYELLMNTSKPVSNSPKPQKTSGETPGKRQKRRRRSR
jgi:dTMP kinase